jgi:assimilatory nitrate reductase catalytic subunit
MPQGCALKELAATMLGTGDDAEWLEAIDAKRGVLRIGLVRDGILEAALFLARDITAMPAESAVIPLLGAPVPEAARVRLLSGRPSSGATAEGPRVCACFGVTRDAIRHAVVTHRLRSAAEIGVVLGAGTNCGSCIPELEEILRDVRAPAA